jgi:hypothetical protein
MTIYAETRSLTGHRISLLGWRLDRHGRLVPDQRRLDVVTRLKQRGSKRVRVVKRTATVPGVRR